MGKQYLQEQSMQANSVIPRFKRQTSEHLEIRVETMLTGCWCFSQRPQSLI
jgi:hypothetical protein